MAFCAWYETAGEPLATGARQSAVKPRPGGGAVPWHGSDTAPIAFDYSRPNEKRRRARFLRYFAQEEILKAFFLRSVHR